MFPALPSAFLDLCTEEDLLLKSRAAVFLASFTCLPHFADVTVLLKPACLNHLLLQGTSALRISQVIYMTLLLRFVDSKYLPSLCPFPLCCSSSCPSVFLSLSATRLSWRRKMLLDRTSISLGRLIFLCTLFLWFLEKFSLTCVSLFLCFGEIC